MTDWAEKVVTRLFYCWENGVQKLWYWLRWEGNQLVKHWHWNLICCIFTSTLSWYWTIWFFVYFFERLKSLNGSQCCLMSCKNLIRFNSVNLAFNRNNLAMALKMFEKLSNMYEIRVIKKHVVWDLDFCLDISSVKAWEPSTEMLCSPRVRSVALKQLMFHLVEEEESHLKRPLLHGSILSSISNILIVEKPIELKLDDTRESVFKVNGENFVQDW